MKCVIFFLAVYCVHFSMFHYGTLVMDPFCFYYILQRAKSNMMCHFKEINYYYYYYRMAARQELEDANVGQQQQTAPVPARPPTHDGQDTVDDAPQPVPGPAVAPAPAQVPPLDQQEQLLQLTRQMLQQLGPRLRRNPERNAFGEWLIECLHNLPNDLYREACKEFQGIMNRYNNEGAARCSGHQQQPSTSFEPDSRPPQLSRVPAGPPPPLAGTFKSPTPTMQQDPGWQPAPYLWNQPSARQQQQAQQQHFSVWNSQDNDYVHQNYPNLYPPPPPQVHELPTSR